MAQDTHFQTARSRLRGLTWVLTVALGLLALPALAEQTRGPVTNQPLPRYVSLKGEEGNARRGPSLTHRIDWVFTRRGMPLQVVGEFGNWRQVRDRDGAGGWMHHILLSRARTVIVQEDLAALHSAPDADAPVRARAEAGVIARLGPCRDGFCRISVGRLRGWTAMSALWGVDDGDTGG